MDQIEEIKSRVDIVDLISEYIQLRPAGTSFKAVCPFHREKTPSFFVSPERQIWHCFGCGKGGSIFDFVMEMDGLDFSEALRILAERAGIKLEKTDRRVVSQKTKLLDICRLSARFYHKVLLESPLAETARKYLKQRALNKKTIENFEIGFAPAKWDSLTKFLIKRNYKEGDMEGAGLSVKKEDRYYDRFRNRIIFPIRDIYSQVVGFTGRVLSADAAGTVNETSAGDNKDKVAKYINTPETPIYNKGRILYGLDKAKMKIKELDSVILVEGNMDVLACHQAGFLNVICTSGTALTEEQIKLLGRYTQNIILGFDVDLAGQNATQRGIDLLLGQGLSVKVLALKNGKDPDECIRENLNEWKRAVKNPQPIMEYYFSSAFKDKDLNGIEDKGRISRELLPVVAKLGDPVEKDLWLKRLSGDLGVSEISLRDGLKRIKVPAPRGRGEDIVQQRTSGEYQIGEKFLALVLKYPTVGKDFLDNLFLDMFVDDRTQMAVKEIKERRGEDGEIDLKKIKEELKDEKLVNYLDYLSFMADEEFKNCSSEDALKELNRFFVLLKRRYLGKRMEKMIQELAQAEKRKDKELIEKISQRIVKLSREIADLK